jgi:uncharacterized protein YbjT (DUF2867 family)
VLVRDAAKAPEGTQVAVGDLLHPATLRPALAGVRRVFVLAAPGPDLEKMENNAFVAAEQAGVEHVVYLSNFGAGRFDGELWAAHGANEWRLRSLRTQWTILRPARFMSNLPFLWQPVLERGRLVEPIGDRPVVTIDPYDVGAVAAQALTAPGHDGKLYELTGQSLTGPQIAASLAAELGRTVEFADCTDGELRRGLLAAGLPAAMVDPTLRYFRTVRAGNWYETTTVRDLLGRLPRTYTDWLREHPPTSFT